MRARRTRAPQAQTPATENPVALVVLELSLAQVDRPFEYLITGDQSELAQPGVRVRVRFAGQNCTGFIVARTAKATHIGELSTLKVISPEVVLPATLLELARAVSARWGGPLADVLRLAIPPRHARAELAASIPAAVGSGAAVTPARTAAAWTGLVGGRSFLERLAQGEHPHAIWTPTPAASEPERDWPAAIAQAAAAVVAAGRGVLVLVPDSRDLIRVQTALDSAGLSAESLSAELGPQARYAAWLRVLRGHSRVVVGTRAAMFAPVHSLGLVVCWDDGDQLHSEPRSPYPHVREVLALRAELERAAALFGGFTRTAETQRMLNTGWAQPLIADPVQARAAAPRVLVTGEGVEPERDPGATARLPSLAWRTARSALLTGPVLVQVPRRGYVPAVACQACRAPARCAKCQGPLEVPHQGAATRCRWCGVPGEACAQCGSTRLRSTVVGVHRTADELGRAFAGVPIIRSSAGEVQATVGSAPALVLATPGAEPVAQGGYSAALLLDPWALLGRSDLRAHEEALRRWMTAAALVRPAAAGGQVVFVGEPTAAAAEALVRWGPVWHAERELQLRTELNFPPVSCMVTLTGPGPAVADLLRMISLPDDVEVLGPVGLPGPAGTGFGSAEATTSHVRTLLRVKPGHRAELVASVRSAVAARSAKKAAGSVRVQVDPLDLI